MPLALSLAVVAVAIALTYVVTRTLAARELAEERASTAAELATARRDNEWLQQELERQQASAGATQALLEKAQASLREAFQSMAAEALHTNRSAFFDLAKTAFEGLTRQSTAQMDARQQALDALVRPLSDTMKEVHDRLGAVEKDRTASFAQLNEQLTALGTTTNTLSRALRTPSVRGRWGEMQLRRVVELAGMLHRCDFEEQPGLWSDAGRQRPDLIVRLPLGKSIVVDAKVPLEAFLDAQEATDDESRTERLQAHARRVREHMERIGSKAYWESIDGESPEMVVMFLPGETLFSAALQYDLSLIEHGLKNRVLLASPITLIALLTTVAHTWRQEVLAENYKEVARLGREFYDRLARFTEHFDDVRGKLDGAVQAYNKAVGSLEARVLVSARRLRELDVTSSPELPFVEPVATAARALTPLGGAGLAEEAVTQPDLPE
jgi:DNA recombination protein RmuC